RPVAQDLPGYPGSRTRISATAACRKIGSMPRRPRASSRLGAPRSSHAGPCGPLSAASLHRWLHDVRRARLAWHAWACQAWVPPAGIEPATHGLGTVTKSSTVALARRLRLHEELLWLLRRRWWTVV